MAEVIQDAQQEFWRPPVQLEVAEALGVPDGPSTMAEACPRCGTEFMIGSRFCHACGETRPERNAAQGAKGHPLMGDFVARKLFWLQSAASDVFEDGIGFPAWLRYLHFHEIKRWIGLPTAPFVAFLIGLGCVAGAIGVSLFYRASNLIEFQAVQMWRMEWLLAATASFVAGILLKKPSDRDPE
jgi:hypothetical protein